MAKDTFNNEAVELNIHVSEMVSDPAGVVTLDPARVQELLADYSDDKPQFPILRVEAGTVSGNGNRWPESLLTDIAEQINDEEKPGYWGHISKEQRPYLFPDPETVWLAAKVARENGKQVLYVKGYNHPESRARKHRRFAKVTSWAGKASGRVVSGVRNIESFALESIDWARPGSNGMSAKVVAWATEMEGSETEVGEFNWATVTLDDIKQHNPSLFDLMKKKVEDETAGTVTEMQEKVKTGEAALTLVGSIREKVGLDDKADGDKVLEVVTEMVEERDNSKETTLKTKIGKVVGEHVKNESAQKAILRLVPISEMEGLSDEKLTEKVEALFDSDDEIKSIVTEMDGAPAPLSGRGRSGSSGGGSKKKYVGMTAGKSMV